MENQNFVVQGRKTTYHKLLITPLKPVHKEDPLTASFQFLREDHASTLELPIVDFLSALDAVINSGAQLIVANRTDDYLILDLQKAAFSKDVIHAVAVRGGIGAFSSDFVFSELRQAVYSSLMHSKHNYPR